MGGLQFLARWRSPLLGATGLALFAAAGPAQAETFRVRAYGTIASSCGLQATGSFASGDFTMAGQSNATAKIDCNKGFTIKVVSQYGQVQNTKTAPAGFVDRLPYSVRLQLPLDTAATLDKTCAAATMMIGGTCEMTAGSGLDSKGSPAFGKTATITASWNAPATGVRPLAGSYSDIITISVVPTP